MSYRAEIGSDNTLTLIAALGAAAAFTVDVTRHKQTPYDALFEASASQYKLEVNLLRSIAMTESSMKADAIGKPNRNGSRDYGLMQINDRTAAHYKVPLNMLLDPGVSIRLAARLLADIRSELGSVYNKWTLIAAYNAGSPAIKRRGIFNSAYVASVLYHWQLFAIGKVI